MRMNRLKIAAAAMLVWILPISCQQQQQPGSGSNTETETPQMAPPIHLGAVHQVYPEQKFALLRIIGPMPKSGTVLITHPMDGTNSRIGNLIVSSEFAARNGIIAADIRSGTVMKGDRVFQYRNISRKQNEESEQESAATAHPILDTVPDSAVQEIETSTEQIPQETDTPTNDTIVETPVTVTDTPQEPAPLPTTPAPADDNTPPAYLEDIPDDINGWN